MPRATIKIDGTAGSDTDAAINTLIVLSNDDAGDERTYRWEVLDQPPGTADAINTPSAAIATITPKKEGSYLLKLVVDEGLLTEVSDTQVLAVRQLKTRTRIPAALERIQADAADGWAVDVGVLLRLVDATRADPGITVMQAGNALSQHDIVTVGGTAVLKSGLPGAESVLVAIDALGTSTERGLLGVVLSSVSGGLAVSSGELAFVRLYGLVPGLTGTPSPGDPVYIANNGTPSLTPGDSAQQLGIVANASGSTYDMVFVGWPAVTVADEISPDRRRWAFQSNPGLTTVGALGTSTAPTTVKQGTFATLNARGSWLEYSMDASGEFDAGWVGPGNYLNKIFNTQHGPRLWTTWEFTGATSDTRIWIGMVSNNPIASATPALSLAAFRYDSATDTGTTFRACTDSGTGTPEVTDTGVTVAQNTRYLFEVDARDAASIVFRINDTIVATHAATIPASTTDMSWVVLIRRTTGSDAKLMRISRVEARYLL